VFHTVGTVPSVEAIFTATWSSPVMRRTKKLFFCLSGMFFLVLFSLFFSVDLYVLPGDLPPPHRLLLVVVLMHYVNDCMDEPSEAGLLEYKSGLVERYGRQSDFVPDEDLRLVSPSVLLLVVCAYVCLFVYARLCVCVCVCVSVCWSLY
jgi:hypothetical protein